MTNIPDRNRVRKTGRGFRGATLDDGNSAMKLHTRVFFQLVGRPFYRRLILPLSMLLFIVVQADANIDWDALRSALTTRKPWEITALFTGLFVFWGLTAGRALKAIWHQPTIAFLIRQPISHWQWVRFLIPSLSIAFIPFIGIWWLAPNYSQTPLHYFGFVGLAWTIVLGGSFRGIASLKWVGVGTVALAILIFAYAHQPWVAFIAVFVSIALLPLSISAIPDQIVRSVQVSNTSLTSKSPVVAIVRRDFRCLWRLERKALSGLIQLAVIAALMMFANRINDALLGHEAFVLSCALLSLALLPVYDILTRLKTRLGTELTRRRWPISYRHRALALLCLVLLMTAPGFTALFLLGSKMGAFYLLLFTLHAMVSVVMLTALFSQTLLDATVSLGWSLWVLLINTVLSAALPAVVYASLAVVVLLIGVTIIVKGLQKYTDQMEIMIHE